LGADNVWRGAPSRKMVAVIQALFVTDEVGRRYFRFNLLERPQRIRDADFVEINRVIDQYRKPLVQGVGL
jgi:hypothetical protein